MELDLVQGAGHSGWEDALQSNQYHYLHHRFSFSNCHLLQVLWMQLWWQWNSVWQDIWHISGQIEGIRHYIPRGLRGKGKPKIYINLINKRPKYQVDEKSARIHDTKATLLGLPDPSFVIYLALNCLVWVLIWKSTKEPLPYLNPHFLAALASVGPVALAQLMVWTQDPRRPILYPFQRQARLQGKLITNALVLGIPLGRSPSTCFFHCFYALGQFIHWYLSLQTNKSFIMAFFVA